MKDGTLNKGDLEATLK